MVNRKFLLKTFLNLYGKINSDWNIFVEIKMVDFCETKSWSTKSERIFRCNCFDCRKWGNYLHQPYADCHYQNRKKYLRPDLRQGYFLSYSHLWFFAETERNKGVESQNSLVESGFLPKHRILNEKFSFVPATPFMGFLVDEKIASTLQTLTRKDFFENWKIAPLWGFGTG